VRRGLFGREVATVHAVDNVSFDIPHRQTVALVGESGCGKTTTGRTILRLLEPTGGQVFFDNEPVFEMNPDSLRKLRRRMQIIFQDPYQSLNPRMTVMDIISEGLALHTNLPRQERRERTAEILRTVGLSPDYMQRYPHEFSGGQRQRIGIGRALATGPDFIVCDEAVSALDVSIQAQIINLLKTLQSDLGVAYLFIAHDLAVVRYLSQRVVVMYLGHVMEDAPTQSLFENPLHPYTRALLSAIPKPVPGGRKERILLKGDVPTPVDPPAGCRFHPRCPRAMEKCRHGDIPTVEKDGHKVKCVLYA